MPHVSNRTFQRSYGFGQVSFHPSLPNSVWTIDAKVGSTSDWYSVFFIFPGSPAVRVIHDNLPNDLTKKLTRYLLIPACRQINWPPHRPLPVRSRYPAGGIDLPAIKPSRELSVNPVESLWINTVERVTQRQVCFPVRNAGQFLHARYVEKSKSLQLNHGKFYMFRERAGLAVQVVFELLAEFFHKAQRGHGGGVAERAEGTAHHVLR